MAAERTLQIQVLGDEARLRQAQRLADAMQPLIAAQNLRIAESVRPILEQVARAVEQMRPMIEMQQRIAVQLVPLVSVVRRYQEQQLEPAVRVLADFVQRNQALFEAVARAQQSQAARFVMSPEFSARLRLIEEHLEAEEPLPPDLVADLVVAFWAMVATMLFSLVWFGSTELSLEQRVALWAGILMPVAAAKALRQLTR